VSSKSNLAQAGIAHLEVDPLTISPAEILLDYREP
jgi:hypothetical protein